MDLFQNLNNWMKSQNASTNPLDNFKLGGQILGTPIQAIQRAVGDNTVKDKYLLEDGTLRTNEEGEVEIDLNDRMLYGLTPDHLKNRSNDIQIQRFKKQKGDDFVNVLGGSLTNEDGSRRTGAELRRDYKNRSIARNQLKDNELTLADVGKNDYGEIDVENIGKLIRDTKIDLKGDADRRQTLLDLNRGNAEYGFSVGADGTLGGLGSNAERNQKLRARMMRDDGTQKSSREIRAGIDRDIKYADAVADASLKYGKSAESALPELGLVGLANRATREFERGRMDDTFHSKSQQYLRADTDRKFAQTQERARRRDHESDRDFADKIRARNQTIDLEVMRMENANKQMQMRFDYEQEANQQAALGSLLGGLFSLGGLL